MSQRVLIIILSVALVASVGLSTAINSALTAQLVASATIAGPAGADGADGSDGEDGTDGVDGVDGAVGATGPMGPAGPAGPAVRGAAGASGAPGAPGPAGAPGADAVSTEPLVYSTGGAVVSIGWTDYQAVTGPGLTVPAGTYSLTYLMSDVSAVVTADGGGFTRVACLLYIDNWQADGLNMFYADQPATDMTYSTVKSFTADTPVELRCRSIYGMGSAVTTEVTWSDISITAIRLD